MAGMMVKGVDDVTVMETSTVTLTSQFEAPDRQGGGAAGGVADPPQDIPTSRNIGGTQQWRRKLCRLT